VFGLQYNVYLDVFMLTSNSVQIFILNSFYIDNIYPILQGAVLTNRYIFRVAWEEIQFWL